MTPTPEPPHASAAPSGAAPRWRTNLLAGVLAVGTIGALSWWVLDRIAYVHVTDARIAGTMITVASRAAGWIDTVAVGEADAVDAGTLLMSIDDREARLLLAERAARKAHLGAQAETLRERRLMIDAQTASRLESRRARLKAAEALVRAAEAEYERASADWARADPMLAREIISTQRWETMRNDHLQARGRLDAAGAELETARAALVEAEADRTEVSLLDAELTALTHQIREARAQHDRQAVVLDDHQVRSPERAVIDQVFIERGEFVQRSQRLLMLHDPDDLWVSANVKETALRHFDVGAKARIRVDAYPGETLQGTVSRIGTAATSEFALLPTPNPSGNFTKITQRVRIRIELDDNPDVVLRPGMMVEVAIER